MIIESPDYEETRQRLMKDPIVMAMAKGLKGISITELAHKPEPGECPTPRYEFMLVANDEYRKRGGKAHRTHIGAIAEALLRLI